MHVASVPAAPVLYRLTSVTEPLPLASLFAVDRPLEVELGSGDGSFLLQYAQANPDRNFIGVERLLGRMRKLERGGRIAALANLRGLRVEASYLVQYLLPTASLAALHIYFPDPWPKRRHQERRLINDRFPEHAARILKPGGHVYLRTDDADYFEQMQRVFSAHPSFRPVETSALLAERLTDFEREFLAKGVPTRRAAYQLHPPTA